ncbi:MAG: AbrB/MazE/SpoVT family DNA-binding domain-containing protein [Candidatus Omnitrophica bacterium]|nr:AbrB/MazE/SpoVT family DNA-binding domain-containing protein [Candidatus Omnitrophota bacterium]
MQAIFKGKVFGAVTVGGRGQLVIPAQLRKALHIKSGDQLMVFAKLDKRVINLMTTNDFGQFLAHAEKVISRLGSKIPRKN